MRRLGSRFVIKIAEISFCPTCPASVCIAHLLKTTQNVSVALTVGLASLVTDLHAIQQPNAGTISFPAPPIFEEKKWGLFIGQRRCPQPPPPPHITKQGVFRLSPSNQ